MKMKAILALLLAALLCFSLTACQKDNAPNSSDTSSEVKSEQNSEDNSKDDSEVSSEADSETSSEDTGSDASGNEEAFAVTEGTWRIDGSMDTAFIEMDGKGSFVSYFASGAVEFEGYLEAVDEYGDGSYRYDMYDPAGEWLNSFMFHEENAFHMGGNDEGFVFIRDDASYEQGESLPPAAALIPGYRFTGLQVLESDNDYNGGYLYKDLTGDGLSVIINCCFASVQDDAETLENYINWTAHEIGGGKPENLTITQSQELTANLTYPVYQLSWKTFENEDTRIWDGIFFMTDSYTYLYACHTTADHHPEMQQTWLDAFDMLSLGE